MSEKQTQLFEAPAHHIRTAEAEDWSPKYYVVLAPEVGNVTVEPYEQYQDGMEALYKILDARDNGEFEGEIFAFFGELVEFTNAVPARRIGCPTKGAYVLKDNDAFEVISDRVVDDRKK